MGSWLHSLQQTAGIPSAMVEARIAHREPRADTANSGEILTPPPQIDLGRKAPSENQPPTSPWGGEWTPPNSPLHPTAQQVQGGSTRPIQATSLFSSEAKQEERTPPSQNPAPPPQPLGLIWHIHHSPQQVEVGRGIRRLKGNAAHPTVALLRGLHVGELGGREREASPPSRSNKGTSRWPP